MQRRRHGGLTDSSPIQVGQLSVRYLADGSQTDSLGMFELKVSPNSNAPRPHRHTRTRACSARGKGLTSFPIPSAPKSELSSCSRQMSVRSILEMWAPSSPLAKASRTTRP